MPQSSSTSPSTTEPQLKTNYATSPSPGPRRPQDFVTGYSTIKDDNGLTMLMYETEDAANRMSKQVRSAVPGAVTLVNVDVREVAAHA